MSMPRQNRTPAEILEICRRIHRDLASLEQELDVSGEVPDGLSSQLVGAIGNAAVMVSQVIAALAHYTRPHRGEDAIGP